MQFLFGSLYVHGVNTDVSKVCRQIRNYLEFDGSPLASASRSAESPKTLIESLAVTVRSSQVFMDEGAEVSKLVEDRGRAEESEYGDEGIDEQGDEGSEEEMEDQGDLGFRFESGVNPLDLTEDASGVDVYQRLEQMEYEALAEKKRKAHVEQREGHGKKPRIEDASAAMIDELMESMSYGGRRRSRKGKKKRRRKGLKRKASEEINRKIADATFKLGEKEYDEAISLLTEVVRLAPNMPEPYHLLGYIYNEKGEETKSLNFYMIAAHLSPKDPALWKYLKDLSIKQNNLGQARYCLSKAISADPTDVQLRDQYADLQMELGNFHNAAEAYVKISKLKPENTHELKKGAKLYLKCGEVKLSINALEDYLSEHLYDSDVSVIELLLTICMKHKKHDKALQHITRAQKRFPENEFPFSLVIKEGICHLHLGDMEKAKIQFNDLGEHSSSSCAGLIIEVGDAYMSLAYYETALKYYLMLDDNVGDHSGKGLLFLKISRCYESLKESSNAITYFYKALNELKDNIGVRLALASLLVEESRVDEAISVLSPPEFDDSILDTNMVTENKAKSWWLDGKIKLKLSQIYRDRGMYAEFVDTIFSLVRESLLIATLKQKVIVKKRLTLSALFNRAKVLNDGQTGNVFQGFRPMAPTLTLSKATRAKKLLEKREMQMKESKKMALDAGIDWISDKSDDDNQPQEIKVPPLPNLLQDEEHHCLIIDLCKALRTTERYWEALQIINLTLKLANNKLSSQKKEELRTLGAQIAYNITDPKHGYDCVKYIVQKHPYSISAWNCYYKVKLKLGKAYSKHSKFLHGMRTKLQDCVAPMLITGHQFSSLSQYQIASKEYLEAYKLIPENPLINLCVGSTLINLTLGFRLQNKHQCIAQGLAFLYQNLLICKNSQEALYNIARAYHHVGLVSLAASYYEKVLATREKDYPIPKLPNESPDSIEKRKPGYCDLRREAAYNLHLIYKRSGAFDLARQVLRDHCSF